MRRRFTRVGHETATRVISMAVFALTCASLPLAKPSDRPTEIRVQVMDSRRHRPLKDRRVMIEFLDEKGDAIERLADEGRTGPDGVVFLKVGQPIPSRMSVRVLWDYPCSALAPFSTQAVLQAGIVASSIRGRNKWIDKRCTADSQAPQPRSQPGKSIFYVHPMNRFVNWWYNW